MRVDAQHGGRAHRERRLRVPEDLARCHRRRHRVEPAEPVRRLAVALSGDDGGGHEAARPLLQPSVRERGLALGQQIRSWDAPHERLRRHLAKVQPARQVLPRRGAADEEGGVRDQERHVELAEHVEP